MSQVAEIKHFEGKKIVSSIGMIVLLISFTMLFATLLLGYVVFRMTSEVWPPMGIQRISLVLPTISTIIIALSSLTYFNFEKSYKAKELKNAKLNFALTFLAGLAFMFVQVTLWQSMKLQGLYVTGGIFPSMFYALTWVHAAHIVMAIFALLLIVPSLLKGYVATKELWVENIGKFWHFLGIVWFVMYIIMFVF
ncbi:cytochrome c oxidase subunit 3 [Bacteriovorax sp. Seq25_V]|uniref:cytochrome c oxidase subunit 3 n=1 Tax=Bacteriovorax sp. Seq25_V TaxID=1201288 RepID=UPI00038A3274|nr:cytochrome c oxidase subunit 3 [Bacteriovorax sp. Seq25_V]EQC43212.1 cytochrome c oxidase, subunit III [Bacteriovorax sp. Seq25_V]